MPPRITSPLDDAGLAPLRAARTDFPLSAETTLAGLFRGATYELSWTRQSFDPITPAIGVLTIQVVDADSSAIRASFIELSALEGDAAPRRRLRFIASGSTMRLQLLSFSHPPLSVTAFAIAEVSPATASLPAGHRRLAPLFQPFLDDEFIAGAVIAVASRDKLLDLETVGFADREARRPMAEDSLFWVASQSKPVLGAAMMILVDEGRLRLDAPVADYLPAFAGQMLSVADAGGGAALRPPHRPPTVRDLLAHTSGLDFKSPVEQPTLDLRPIEAAVQSYAGLPLLAEPGSRYIYSNAGINTAARIIEVLSGQTYEDFLDERLFRPLGLVDSTFVPTAGQVARLAKAYGWNAEKSALVSAPIECLRYPLEGPGRYAVPAGGLFSTARDLVRFCQMILNDGELEGRRVLSAAAVREMTSRHTAPSLPESYGLGWKIDADTVGHRGAHATGMQIDRARDLITVFLIQNYRFKNPAGDTIYPLFQEAAALLYGSPG